MPEYTEDDVTRLVGMMPQYNGAISWDKIARTLLAQGVTLPPPPPAPAVVVAEAIYQGVKGHADRWDPETFHTQAGILAAVRDLFTPEALAQAAAKVQEADREAL